MLVDLQFEINHSADCAVDGDIGDEPEATVGEGSQRSLSRQCRSIGIAWLSWSFMSRNC